MPTTTWPPAAPAGMSLGMRLFATTVFATLYLVLQLVAIALVLRLWVA